MTRTRRVLLRCLDRRMPPEHRAQVIALPADFPRVYTQPMFGVGFVDFKNTDEVIEWDGMMCELWIGTVVPIDAPIGPTNYEFNEWANRVWWANLMGEDVEAGEVQDERQT